MPRNSRRRTPPGMKWCPKCELIKPSDQFRGGYCIECSKSYSIEWSRTTRKVRLSEARQAIVDHYGGHCSHCDETDPELMIISPTRGRGQRDIIEWLAREGYPRGYKITCVICDRKLRNRR